MKFNSSVRESNFGESGPESMGLRANLTRGRIFWTLVEKVYFMYGSFGTVLRRMVVQDQYQDNPELLEDQVGTVIFECPGSNMITVMPAVMQPGDMHPTLWDDDWTRNPYLGVEEDWVEGLKRRSRISGLKLSTRKGAICGRMTEREWDRWCSTVSSFRYHFIKEYHN